MRISDWSSDVCSSDLAVACGLGRGAMSRFDADFATVLDAAAAVGNRRVLKTADPEGAARMRRKGRLLTDFSGNDYLGLSHHPLLKRSEEHTSELQSLMRISYAGFCLKKKKTNN